MNEDHEFAATRWSDALSSGRAPRAYGGAAVGSRLVDSRVARVPGAARGGLRAHPPHRRPPGLVLRRPRCGGCAACSTCPFGGAGLRRGRRDPDQLLRGDTVDFWRVEAIEPDRLLRLSAEMTPPRPRLAAVRGRAGDGGSIIRQTAIFDPVGLLGRLYWYAIWPLHGLVFRGMVRGIARAAVRSPEARTTATVGG